MTDPITEATPRLFLGRADTDFGIYDENDEPLIECAGSREFATLIVRAVNSLAEIEAVVEAVEKIIPPKSNDWWCPQCSQKKAPVQVTFEERCADCGSDVSADNPFDAWGPVRAALQSYREKMK